MSGSWGLEVVAASGDAPSTSSSEGWVSAAATSASAVAGAGSAACCNTAAAALMPCWSVAAGSSSHLAAGACSDDNKRGGQRQKGEVKREHGSTPGMQLVGPVGWQSKAHLVDLRHISSWRCHSRCADGLLRLCRGGPLCLRLCHGGL